MNPDHPLVFDPNQLLLESTAIISQEAVSSHLFIATNVSTCDDEKKEFQSTRPNEPFHFAHQNDEERTENEKCESNEEQRAIPRIVQVEQRSVSSFSDSPFSERQNDKKDVALSPEQIKQTELDESNELDKIEEEEEEKEELSSEHSSMSNMLAYQSSLPLSHSSSSLFTPSAQNLTHPTSSTRQIDRFFFRISFFISFFFVVAFAVILLVFEERQGLFADDFVLKTSSSSKYSSNDISRIPQRVIPSHISSRTMKGFPPISETDDKSNYERQKNERQSQQEYIQREKFRSIAPDLAKKLPVPQRAQFQRPRITSRIVGEENYN
ncbi:uncharacterized protein MONOS_123 [Monocercomonoides exilis]|uniref:uncharacterized protein n=1 Tax=Monocercomonoides exilis TaxID=2049356 RepID=UPI00355AC2A2|nr:hypothetical protein MONOS_123 [Monocercomonoides exilis]|eukprot:MONOS_123.1-p1 / transcript=MONOS_123.1 / gene=MONOS_123 / organism=Monocercomonoides_exilis_PA203 / gene_product=unspecified product / transcript_product=unspecified product / location=Mono_scaffold00002:228941-229912(-) / protein_length=324 / sequence_SO=supercontig / SO=protein_coding / is_pseudo=false